jgi:hypothetical protein
MGTELLPQRVMTLSAGLQLTAWPMADDVARGGIGSLRVSTHLQRHHIVIPSSYFTLPPRDRSSDRPNERRRDLDISRVQPRNPDGDSPTHYDPHVTGCRQAAALSREPCHARSHNSPPHSGRDAGSNKTPTECYIVAAKQCLFRRGVANTAAPFVRSSRLRSYLSSPAVGNGRTGRAHRLVVQAHRRHGHRGLSLLSSHICSGNEERARSLVSRGREH